MLFEIQMRKYRCGEFILKEFSVLLTHDVFYVGFVGYVGHKRGC